MNHRFHRLFVGVICLLMCLGLRAAFAAPPIKPAYGPVLEISFSGNEATSEVLLRDELGFSEGDAYREEMLAAARQSLMDLGLFSTVTANAKQQGFGVVVSFVVDEKHYLLPLPRISRSSDGDITLGGQLRFDNLFGLNHQFKLTLEREKADEGRGRETDRLRLDYKIPRIIHSRWGLGVGMREERYPIEETVGDQVDEWARSHRSLGFSISRNLDDLTPSNPGWSIGFGVLQEQRQHEAVDTVVGEEPAAGYHRAVSFGLSHNNVHESRYRRFGDSKGASLVIGGGPSGGDYDYSSVEFFYRIYQALDGVADNLNSSFRFGLASGSAWDDPRFSLGNSRTLRGVESGSVEGDTMLLINVERLVAVPGHPRFRFVFFSDIGNAWPRYELDITDLRATLGTGFRWKLDSFVRTDLRLDVGYDIDTGDTRVYGGTNVAF